MNDKGFLGKTGLDKLISLIHGIFTSIQTKVTDLTSSFDQYKTATDTAIEAANTAIQGEVTRATAAEKANADAITALQGQVEDVETKFGEEMTEADVEAAWNKVFNPTEG